MKPLIYKIDHSKVHDLLLSEDGNEQVDALLRHLKDLDSIKFELQEDSRILYKKRTLFQGDLTKFPISEHRLNLSASIVENVRFEKTI